MRQTAVVVVTTALLLFLSWAPLRTRSLPATEYQNYSRSECTWAVQWINNGLSLFMERGYIAKISAKDDGFDVYVGSPWYRLAFHQQGEFLKNLSRAREITGHAAFYSVLDAASGATVARVTPLAIELLTPDEGFKQYQPAGDAEKNTVY
jgi:hypothetical protein